MVASVGRIFRAQTLASHAAGFFVGAMTPVIFITIGFLSCWFLLYVLMEWTQDRQCKSGSSGGETRKLIRGSTGTGTSVILEAKKEFRRERCVKSIGR
jgi:hypothetical protein